MMLRSILKKCITFLMVIVMVVISVTGFCRSASAIGPSDNIKCADGVKHLDTGKNQSPASPSNDHAAPDHCDSSCSCPCHAPLTAQPSLVVCVCPIDALVFFEPYKALPEVYLPKFIPPHILA